MVCGYEATGNTEQTQEFAVLTATASAPGTFNISTNAPEVETAINTFDILIRCQLWRRTHRRLNRPSQISIERAIGELSLAQLEALAEALLDFNSLQDLQQWLEHHS